MKIIKFRERLGTAVPEIIGYDNFLKSLDDEIIYPVYLFCGGEKFFLTEAVIRLKGALLSEKESQWNYVELDAEKIDDKDLFSELIAVPFFGEKRILIIKNSQKYFGSESKASKKEGEVIEEYFDRINSSCTVVFIMDGKVDKRKKIYGKLLEKGAVVEFLPLKGKNLTKWIGDQFNAYGKKIEKTAREYLAAGFDDLELLKTEIQKIVLFCGEESSMVTLEQVKEAVSRTQSVNIFDIIDAVGNRNSSLAVELVREMLAAGESPVFILYMISKHLRTIFRVKSLLQDGYSEKQIVAKLQLHPYAFRKIMEQSKNFSMEDLKKILRLLLKIDLMLKTSSVNSKLLLEMGVVELCL
ncbi:MAG TPA: DNA polymerase III subunit delta [Peptococcaceae bacterium]|nr:MAG: DNA polymerase III, delta subunit [Clostridia bacterium 41_269]HBT20327.1 DNA polymerase III subunit delta [Peptococcaceae bacterium]